MSLFNYVLKRFLSVLPLLLILPFITLFLMHLIPGNYFDSLRMNPQISAETISQYEKLYHIDKPFIVQYWYWLNSLCRFDLGYSFVYKQSVAHILASRMANTLLLTGVSFALAWVLAVVFGLLAGALRNTLFDRFFLVVSYLGLSIPNFFLCILLLYAASRFGGLPLGGMRSVLYDELGPLERVFDVIRHMIIPVAVLSLTSFAYLFRLMRSQCIEVLQRDFIFHLLAQRVPKVTVLFKHAARNAINPMITLFGLELPALFSGAALVEIFTGWPGLGQILLQAVRSQDIFLVLGNMVMISILLIAGNLLADILLVVMDPRIRLEARHNAL